VKQSVTIILILFSAIAQAQTRQFTEAEFLSVIRKYHPIAKQAALDVRIAEAELTASRGLFDPVLRGETGRKELDGINYYNVRQTEIRIPTWYGIDLYAGTEKINGTRINPEETKGTLDYFGFSIPLIQNVIIDKRRAAVQQAKIYQDLSELERQVLVNDLLTEALVTYWNWWQQYRTWELMQSFRINAEQRLNMVRATWQGGERPAIDTLEALTQVQAIAIRQQEVLGELLKTRLELSAFLWTENEKQYDLPSDAVPQSREGNQQLLLDDLLRNANQHPLLTQYEQKLDILTIERRLKFQGLLPKADLKYNQIGSTFSKTASAAWFQNNYRFGVSFSMPLRLSQGRGEYRMAKLKIEQTTLEQLNKTVQVQTKVRQYYTDWQQTNQQLVLQEQMLRNVTALQRGEEVKFENGESSLFLINARELKTMETMQKLVELQSKNQKALIQVQWAAGYFGR